MKTTRLKFNKKVIVWSIAFFILGIIIAPNKTTIVEKEVSRECPKCEIANLEKAISLYEQILDLDSEAFNIAADNTGLIMIAAEAGMYMDTAKIEQITATLKSSTAKINNLANQKRELLREINLLKR